MARPLRIEYPGAFYHVTSRGNERKEIFRSRRDRVKFLEYLESATVRYGFAVHAYCLMTNHYHLLVETPEGNLAQGMRHVNGAYTTYFNVKRQRSGHLLQGRYKAILVEKDEYAEELSRYIHLNPVRAGAARNPEGYPWSSYAAYVGLVPAPPWLRQELVLSAFGRAQASAQEKYREFVEAGVVRQLENPLERVVASTVLGGAGFVEWVRERFVAAKPADREVPASRALGRRPSLEGIEKDVSGRLGDDHRAARRLALYVSHRYSGLPLREIGERFGVGASGVSQASRRVEAQMSSAPELRRVVEEVVRGLGLSQV
ncbi:MAG: transposase [Deferrisomatales bacterium]|nr:transposase [Deferrisomatales bacterium]